jgi:hypothetical protein
MAYQRADGPDKTAKKGIIAQGITKFNIPNSISGKGRRGVHRGAERWKKSRILRVLHELYGKNGRNRTAIPGAQEHLFYSTRLRLMPIKHLSERCDASILASREPGIEQAF